jgi:hypothetical protein
MWYSSIYKSLIIASIFCFLLSFFSTGEVAFGSVMTGYSTLTLGILMIMFILFTSILEVTKNETTFQVFYEMFITTGPFLLMLTVIGVIMFCSIFYKDKILAGNVSQGYTTFSNITIFLLLFQIYILYTNISNKSFETTKKISKITSSTLYLFGVLTMISSLTLYSIVKYFSADGFTNNFR